MGCLQVFPLSFMQKLNVNVSLGNFYNYRGKSIVCMLQEQARSSDKMQGLPVRQVTDLDYSMRC